MGLSENENSGDSLAFSRKMYDRVSKLGRIGIWECDLATEDLTWTPAVFELFDLPPGSPISREQALACYEPNSRRELERRRAEAIATCSSFTVDVAIRGRANNVRWIRITGDVEQEDGRAARIFGTKQDITQEKEAQLRLQALQSGHIHRSRLSAIDAMASTLAHELNQPLAAMIMYAAGLRHTSGGEPIDDETGEMLEGIERCALKAGDILRAMRGIAVSEDRAPTEFDLNEQIVEACQVALAGEPEGLTVHYALRDGLRAFADPVQIQQVVINLIRNACEAMATSGRREITISTGLKDGEAEVSITDTGIGLPAELHGSLFEPFVSSRPDGTGLGLAISRTIVEAHSGTLTAENIFGGGATVRFSIPAAQDDDAATEG